MTVNLLWEIQRDWLCPFVKIDVAFGPAIRSHPTRKSNFLDKISGYNVSKSVLAGAELSQVHLPPAAVCGRKLSSAHWGKAKLC